MIMGKNAILKYKGKFYIFLLGVLHFLGISFLYGCSSSGSNNNSDRLTDTIKRVDEFNDSINKEKHIKDSLTQLKKTQDSLAKIDAINKTKKNKNNYNPPPPKCMYGPPPNMKK